MSKTDRHTPSQPPTCTRREALGMVPAVLAIGAGMAATLHATDAKAGAPAYELRFFKKEGDKLVPLDNIPLPPQVVQAIESGKAGKLEFAWHVKRGDTTTKLAQLAAPGRDPVAAKRPGPPK